MANGSLTRLFRRALDRLDYWLTQAALSPADAVCGPEPETTADLEERARSGAHLLVIFGGSLVSCVEVIRSALVNSCSPTPRSETRTTRAY